MNRSTITLVAIAATIAGIAASLFTVLMLGATQPEPVQAAPEAPAPGTPIRIAVVNLEEVSHNSPLFRQRSERWEAVRQELRAQTDEMKAKYRSAVEEYETAKLRDDDETDVLVLAVAVKAHEEAMKAAREEQGEYLETLLNEFQTEVLTVVLANIQRYARQEGYQLVLQDYTLGSVEEGFFKDNAYAQTLMSKPVLDAPGMSSGTNTHVTDITKIMVDFMRKGGVPEKDD